MPGNCLKRAPVVSIALPRPPALLPYLQDTVSDLKAMQLTKEEQQRRRRVRESKNAVKSGQEGRAGVLRLCVLAELQPNPVCVQPDVPQFVIWSTSRSVLPGVAAGRLSPAYAQPQPTRTVSARAVDRPIISNKVQMACARRDPQSAEVA